MDKSIVESATEEVLAEMGLEGREFVVEEAMAAPNSQSAQIRLLDDTGDGKAVVVNFTREDGTALHYVQDIKERIREQLETLIDTTE